MSRKQKKSTGRSKRLKKTARRLAAYSAAAAATVMTAQGSANAAEKVWDLADVTSGGGNPNVTFNVKNGTTGTAGNGLYISPVHTKSGSFGFGFNGGKNAGMAGRIYARIGSISGGFANTEGVGFGPDPVTPNAISPSSSVSAGLIFGGETNFPDYGNFADLVKHTKPGSFVGLQFKLGGSKHYGWAEITVDLAGDSTTLHAFGYNTTPDAATHPTQTVSPFADLNEDLEVNTPDWVILRDNNQRDLSGLTPEAAYLKGDLDGDLDNDIADFDLFRKAYEAANPAAGAFEAMVASAVPEPNSMLLLAAGAAGLGRWRKRKAG